jgi:hypothetical protein
VGKSKREKDEFKKMQKFKDGEKEIFRNTIAKKTAVKGVIVWRNNIKVEEKEKKVEHSK